VIVRTP